MSRKTGKEARAERITWFALILIFIPLNFGDWLSTIPAYLFPFAVAVVLLFSGIYQWRKDWRVSPIVWIVAALMLVVGGVEIYYPAFMPFDPVLAALIAAVGIILFGVLSNES
ncbi:MAG: hypothetical protein MUE40_01135 [Anaerolineae bacterium]|jgi:peptidoglycan/LPS O-acetylase OafA/YrhL|nr:hypothetical protein [Anaerolineae bacterium]